MTMQSLVTFRVDGSHHLGTGHIVRCLVLARAFRKRDVQPVFVVKDDEPRILELIDGQGCPVTALPSLLTMEEDASATNRIVARSRSTFLVTDVANMDYTADADRYEKYCRAVLARTSAYSVSLDDQVIADLPFDMRIIPYCGSGKRPHEPPEKTKWLLGPAYFIFQEEFEEASRVDRTVQREARRILVTMGGSDPYQLTAAVLDSLRKVRKEPGLEVRVVIGPGFSHRAEQEIREKAIPFRGACHILSGTPGTLAQQMLWSDLAVTAGGLTKYEAAVTGTPNIIIAAFPREVEMCRFFSDAGASRCLDRSRICLEEDLAGMVETLMGDYETRTQMSRRGKALVDGCGVDRILSEIPSALFPLMGR
jgi:UDP-2,4-diacetamido-2,4,6-trideoxy-beta-L-altropyranose hydrolase